MKYESISFRTPETPEASEQEFTIDSIDLKPEKEKTPIPVLFAPGWGFTPETLNQSFEVLVENGRRVISLAHIRESSQVKSDKHVSPELQKAYALLALLDKKHIEKVDAVAHSEGSINLAIAALEHPEKFRNIVFINPAGMIGENTFPKHIFKFYTEVFQDFKASLRGKGVFKSVLIEYKEIAKYFLSNPALSLREAVAISQADILQMISELKQHNIGVSVISGVDDKIIPMDKLQEKVSSNSINGFYSVKGGHNEILFQPIKYMGAVDTALDALEKRGVVDK
ncbi:MAG: hypothetical protein A2V96_02975 [Candidatus Yonathbacteria bacterium RBG_16_43_6]|uniref:AB hydrolase-1 domain-containing protein n=1 Tax=Candidatus Yonathbacteria bacterium RIFCSPLOWO2_01_FULL_43_27 TaxID=1802726 RepID=A0A1G2SBV1_9BACT|nr:MAG: hypothetical protein A2V96_02975 [Candidatus Yonathbacteria bacterium RBG_16_43_6]OHA82510.1 MAG: hypothetical protein A3B07_02715 [Candidatus Yonathbacteria bacterium RIFCSPLOWO2_01_FULL_43_27]